MKRPELTGLACNAKFPATNLSTNLGERARVIAGRREWRWPNAARFLALAGSITVAGCVNLTAPENPIVIELNINITQEVIYRLAEDASDAIEENADIF